MKRTNKKGFTIVELVIVIAVIGILAAVLIPTFSNVTEEANKTSALQECRNALTTLLVEKDGSLAGADYYFSVLKGGKTYTYKYDGSKLVDGTIPAAAEGTTITEEANTNGMYGSVTVTKVVVAQA